MLSMSYDEIRHVLCSVYQNCFALRKMVPLDQKFGKAITTHPIWKV